MKKSAVALGVGVLLSGLLAACGGSDDGIAASVANPAMFFNRTATFAVCAQIGDSCESDTETAAEIVAASADGMTLIYQNARKAPAFRPGMNSACSEAAHRF